MMRGFVYGSAWSSLDLSPFCAKLIAYATFAKVPITFEVGSPLSAPKKKLPYIEWDGRVIADTTAIISAWSEGGWDLNTQLTQAQRHESRMIQSMVEEHLYFLLLHYRWVVPQGWAMYEEHIRAFLRRSGVPGPVVGFAAGQARRGVRKSLDGQGSGRQAPEFLERQSHDLIGSLAHALSQHDGPFVMGARPCAIDATVYAFADAIEAPPIASPLVDALTASPVLMAYLEHVRAHLRDA